MGYSLWGHKELDMTEQLTHTHTVESVCVCVYIKQNTTQLQKKMNFAICSNMDGPGDYHTK